MSAVRRYDRLAPVYEIGIAGDLLYRAARHEAIRRLDLFRGARVSVLFCGTGLDFKPIRERIGGTGGIFAVDGSAGMLKHARKRCRNVGFSERRSQLFQADFCQPCDVAMLCKKLREYEPDRLFISMGLNCLPAWEPFCASVLGALMPGAKVAMFDLYAKKRSVKAALLNGVGAGDCRRAVWKVVERCTENFELCWLPPRRLLGVSLFAAAGTIPAGVSKPRLLAGLSQ